MNKIVNGKVVAMTDEEIAEYNSRTVEDLWKLKRLNEYPSIQECIHAILDNELDALQEKRTAVKAKYPKPS